MHSRNPLSHAKNLFSRRFSGMPFSLTLHLVLNADQLAH
jgi:hypothetical protein